MSGLRTVKMHQVLAYFKFLWKSTNQHGVHSPFVYDLVTKCFYDRKQHPAYGLISRYRRQLLQNPDLLEVKDFGAGSRVFRSNKRKISAIAQNAGITPKRARLLNRLVRYLGIRNALELGTSLGIGSAAMASGNQVQITTLEGCPHTAGIAAQKFREFKWDTIDLKVGEFEGHFREEFPGSPKKASEDKTYDLVFFDGNHQKRATLEYFRTLLPLAHNDTVFIFDDIHWSEEMTEAWEEIKSHSSVRVTIDTFQWGLVFFRREQEKEHFVIRV